MESSAGILPVKTMKRGAGALPVKIKKRGTGILPVITMGGTPMPRTSITDNWSATASGLCQVLRPDIHSRSGLIVGSEGLTEQAKRLFLSLHYAGLQMGVNLANVPDNTVFRVSIEVEENSLLV